MSDDTGVEIRAVRAEEADDTLHVLCAAFGLSYEAARPIYYQDPFFALSHKRLLRTPDDGIISCLTVIPTRIRVGAAWVPAGGIAGMATRPDRRRQGWGSRLLAATASALADELHYPLSPLFARSESYYGRLGWETVSDTALWRGRLADLPDSAEAAFVRPLGTDDGEARAALHSLQAAEVSCRTGTCARDDRRWRIIEGIDGPLPGREWVVFQPPGEPVSGYACYELATEGGESVLRVQEMHGATASARRGLVGYFAVRTALADSLEWPTTTSDLGAFGLSPDTTTREPGMMLRLTDLPAALAATHAANLAPVLVPSGCTLTLRATDSIRPENERPVRLTAAGVSPGAETDTDWIAADIRVLAKLYLGYCIPSDAQAQGRLQASSPVALALADALFPARAPFVAPLDQF